MKKFNYKTVITLTIIILAISSCVKEPVNNGTGGGSGSGTGGSGGTNPPTKTPPSTTFIASQDYNVSNQGAYYTEQFTVSVTSTFVFRLATSHKAQAAVFTSSQLSAFETMQAFTGYGIFDNQFGTQSITLAPGTYYLGVRNTYSGANKWSWELDQTFTFPASDRLTYYDQYFQGTSSQPTGGKIWQAFTIQNGFRYFIDGCNVNSDFYIIPESQLSNFQNNITFQYYTDYYMGAIGGAPGLWEINLPPGNYYLIANNSAWSAWTFIMDRYKVN